MKNILKALLLAFIYMIQGCSPGNNVKIDNKEIQSHSVKTEIPALLKSLSPEPGISIVNPCKVNTLKGKNGTILTVPENAFKSGDGRAVNGEVKISLTEAMNSFDLLTTAVSMTCEGGRTGIQYFESAGMFRITAVFGDEPLLLSGDKKISVKFPDFVPGHDFFVYRLNDNGLWILDGHNRESIAPDQDTDSALVKLRVRNYDVTGLGWWNFDKPSPDTAALKGKVSLENGVGKGKLYVYSLGFDRIGYFQGIFNKNRFRVNVLKNTAAKVLIIDENGNIGLSGLIKVSERTGSQSYPEGPGNFNQDAGNIIIKKTPAGIFKSRRDFLDFLGYSGK